MLKKSVVIVIENKELDRNEAFQAMNAIANKAKLRWQADGKTEEEIEYLISETIKEIRDH